MDRALSVSQRDNVIRTSYHKSKAQLFLARQGVAIHGDALSFSHVLGVF